MLGLAELGADRSAEATATSTSQIVQEVSGPPEEVQRIKRKFLFFAADNAADEMRAGSLLKGDFPNMNFILPDSTHSIQLAIKNGARGIPKLI